MEAVGLFVTLEARAGKEADAEAFLKSVPPQVERVEVLATTPAKD